MLQYLHSLEHYDYITWQTGRVYLIMNQVLKLNLRQRKMELYSKLFPQMRVNYKCVQTPFVYFQDDHVNGL